VEPAAFAQTIVRYRNQRWAERVGLGGLDETAFVAHFGRFEALPGSFPKPLALRYHGHQFGSYNPDLGDGRGFLFAQLHDLADGRLLDLGTKGSGRTPWSRSGDGRLTLNGGIREVLATEMLEALGVNTSKSFSLIETGEALERGDEPSPTRSAVLVRLSHSHLRIGSFQRLLYFDDTANIGRLLDYIIETYRPALWQPAIEARAIGFLETLTADVARMGAQWMAAGFVHGVLNTDNINVTGESFDYGPWRFLPTYDPAFTAAYFDYAGRYAYGRQPNVLLWNLTRLAECLLPLAPQPALETALRGFAPAYRRALAGETLRRLGVASSSAASGEDLTQRFWSLLATSQAPFEQVLFDCYGGPARAPQRGASPCADLYQTEAFADLRRAFEAAEPRPGIDLDHRYFAQHQPCTMLIDEVDAILKAVAVADDWSPFDTKLQAIASMADAYGIKTPAAAKT
jgi:uncharacterized protein YdiU (UPF0061 family)